MSNLANVVKTWAFHQIEQIPVSILSNQSYPTLKLSLHLKFNFIPSDLQMCCYNICVHTINVLSDKVNIYMLWTKPGMDKVT